MAPVHEAPQRDTAPQPQPPKKGVRYIPALDGLRAVAVLAVIAYHLGVPGLSGGLMGVTVFFVISGYIVTKILLVEFSRTGRIGFKDFYIRRAKRLLPAIVLVIAATGTLCTLFNHVLLTKMRPEVLPSLLFVNNWWQIFNDASYFENIGLPSPLTHFWSLAIEEQFYLVLPLTLLCVLKFGGRLGRRRNLAVMMLVLAGIFAVEMVLLFDPTQDPTRVYYGTDTRAFSLLIGAFVAVITTGSRRRLPRGQREGLAVAGAVGVLLCLSLMAGDAPFTYQGGMVLCSALTAMLIYGTLWKDSGLVAKALSARPLIWVGKRSYGLYLWHYPLVLLFTPANGSDSTTWLLMAAALACTFACAALSYRFVENPIRYGIAKQKEAQAHEPAAGARQGQAQAQAQGQLQPQAHELQPEPPAARPGDSGELPVVRGLFDPDLWPADATGSMPAVAAAMVGGSAAHVEAPAPAPAPAVAAPDAPAPQAPTAESAPRPSAHAHARARAKRRRSLPLQPAAATLVAVLVAVSTGGFLFAGDASALSDDGAAVILRGSLAGEPLAGDVALASGDQEVQVLGAVDEAPEEKPVYDVLMIGDSVSLRTVPYFEERFPLGHIDAAKSRRIGEGIAVYQQYEDDGQVGDTVVFALGTNGRLTEESLRELVEAVGPDRQIYFVTVRSSDYDLANANNAALNQARDAYDNVHLIDWNALSADHGDYFDGDGIHLTDSAAHIYVRFIADVLQYPSAEEVLAQAAQTEDAA